MLQHALMPGAPTSAGSDATYGYLVERADGALGGAASLSPERFTNAESARRELGGYLRFIRTAGRHVDFLSRLVGPDAEDIRSLGQRLATSSHRYEGPSSWHSAATYLGAADDLVKSHLDSGLMNRTSEAEELLTAPRLLAALRDTIQSLSAVAEVRSRLTRRVSALERGTSGDGRVSDDLILTARRAERHIHVQGRAAMWDLHRLGVDETSEGLASLRVPVVAASTAPSPTFEGAMTALRTLRQLSFDQARGRVPTSPASLRDLARLGEVATAPGIEWLPDPSTGLARVQHATVVDGLNAAHDAWRRAGVHLTTTIQGLTQAPGRYAEAVRLLQDVVQERSSARLAVITALPALATEASRAILDLATNGSLVTRQRVPLHLHGTWARIPFENVHALIQSFETAGQASRSVTPCIRQLAASPPARAHAGEAPANRSFAKPRLNRRLSR